MIEFKTKRLFIEIDGTASPFHIVQKGNKIHIHNTEFGVISLDLQEHYPTQKSKNDTGNYVAPMPSPIKKIVVEEDQKIEANQPLIVLNSMKMESTIIVHKKGTVQEIKVTEGQTVASSHQRIHIV